MHNCKQMTDDNKLPMATKRYIISGECLEGEGLVWLIGAVVCLLPAYHKSDCKLARAMDERI